MVQLVHTRIKDLLHHSKTTLPYGTTYHTLYKLITSTNWIVIYWMKPNSNYQNPLIHFFQTYLPPLQWYLECKQLHDYYLHQIFLFLKLSHLNQMYQLSDFAIKITSKSRNPKFLLYHQNHGYQSTNNHNLNTSKVCTKVFMLALSEWNSSVGGIFWHK